MAFTLTLRGTAANVSGQQTQTIGAFTPSANSELFVLGAAVAATTPGVATCSDGIPSTYTVVAVGNAFNTTNRLRMFRTSIGSSPVSMTPQLDWLSVMTNCGMICFDVTGLNTGTPVVAGSSVQTTGGSDATPTTPAAPALADANNMQILVGHARRSALDSSPKAGWTELSEVFGANCDLAVYYRIANYDASPNYTLAGAALWGCGAFEVAIAQATGGLGVGLGSRRSAMPRLRRPAATWGGSHG